MERGQEKAFMRTIEREKRLTQKSFPDNTTGSRTASRRAQVEGNLKQILDLMKSTFQTKWLPVVVGLGFIAQTAGAATPVPTLVYDNTTTPLNAYFATQTEAGDQISPPGGGWIADTFSFEYFASGLSGNETAKVRFYANDGPSITGTVGGDTPSTVLYESPSFKLINGNIPVTVTDLASLNVLLPKSFTWTVSPSGVDGSEIFGLKLYNPPIVGSSLDDVWQSVGGDWQLKQVAGHVANLGAQLIAVPEPGSMTLLGLGAAALFLRRRQVAA